MPSSDIIKFIPISYMTYNWINVIASIIIISFAIWFSVSDDFDITTQKIWVPSVIIIALLMLLVSLENNKTLMKNILIGVCGIILFALGSGFVIPIALLILAIFIIMNIHTTIIKFILKYKNIFLIILFVASGTSFLYLWRQSHPKFIIQFNKKG